MSNISINGGPQMAFVGGGIYGNALELATAEAVAIDMALTHELIIVLGQTGEITAQAMYNFYDSSSPSQNANRITANVGGTSNLGRSAHAQQRAKEGRPINPARNDVQNARDVDILRQEDGRWVVRGKNGRISIFEPD